MEENTKKTLESFKNLNGKRQSAFLDILNDLLITTKPVKKDQNTFERIMIDKAFKDSDLIPNFDENISDEEKAIKLGELTQMYNGFVKSYNSFTKGRGVGIFLYNKDKIKLIEEVNNEYGYIDEKTLKNIYTDRGFFIATLEELGFIEKIDINKEFENFIISLKKNKVIENKFNFNDFKKKTNGFLEFSDDKCIFLSKEKIKDESYKKYIESISNFFPFNDIIGEANEIMNNLKLFMYFYNMDDLIKLDGLLSFETNLKKRKTFFKFEDGELNINGFKIHRPEVNTKIENILMLIYEGTLRDKSLDFIKIDTIKTILREKLNDYKFYKAMFLKNHYFELYTNTSGKTAKDELYNIKESLINENITTKQFNNSLKSLNKKIFKQILGINKTFFRVTKDGVYIQYK